MTTTELPSIATATATRQGTGTNNADATAVFATEGGTVCGAVIDVVGHPAVAPAIAQLLAETAARVGAQRGTFAGLLSAGLLIADPGAGAEPDPDAVGVAATIAPGGPAVISWIGDCHAYGWDGTRLHRYTTPHTYGQQLREYGAPWEIAEGHDDWIVTSLAHATPATVLTVTCDDPLVILASDGIDCIPVAEFEALIREHADSPQTLADMLVATAREDADGYRDDATVTIIAAG